MKNILIIIGLLISTIVSSQYKPTNEKRFCVGLPFHASYIAQFNADSTIDIKYNSYTFKGGEVLTIHYSKEDIKELKNIINSAIELKDYLVLRDVGVPFQKSLGHINGIEYIFDFKETVHWLPGTPKYDYGDAEIIINSHKIIQRKKQEIPAPTYSIDISHDYENTFIKDYDKYYGDLLKYNYKHQKDLDVINGLR